jgi:signal transduction histidine kinase
MSREDYPRSASLKHELRTPLNHIIGYCEMAIEEAQDQGQSAFIPDLERIHTAGKRLLGVIDDLFDRSKRPGDKSSESLLQHELRTPLNQIIGYAEILQEEASDRGQESFIPDFEKIHAAARQLLESHHLHAGGGWGGLQPTLGGHACLAACTRLVAGGG